MNIWKINERDTANGEGVRVTLFVTGCANMPCRELCFNKSIQDFRSGTPFTQEHEKQISNALNHPYISGLTILGGEPFLNFHGLTPLLKRLRSNHPDLNIWIYSGFTWEQIVSNKHRKELLELCDVLVDGHFVQELSDVALRFRGSSNQRIIDIKKTLQSGEITKYCYF